MKNIYKAILVFIVLILVIIPQTGCGQKEITPISKESFYFDTICKITIFQMDDMTEDNAKSVIDKAFDQCKNYENTLSKTKKNSDIYRINHAKGKPVKCKPMTIDLIKKGIKYGDMTSGKFDITIGKAENLWDFHSRKNTPPSKKALKDVMKYVDYKQIKISGNTVRMGTSKGEIDLGGIAKGYIADGLADYLESLGVKSGIISLGGNIECIGDKGGKAFQIGIEKPFSNQNEIIGATPLNNGTIVTSGIYERYFEYKGVRYHHILDSKTGMPVDSDVLGVSIKAGRGKSVDCDSLATICLIYGSEKGSTLLNELGEYESLFIRKDESLKKSKEFRLKQE